MDKIIQFIKDLDIGTKITAGVLLILIFISGVLLINNGKKTEVKEVVTVTLKDVNIIDNASGFLINDNKLTLENGVNYLMTVEKVPKTAGGSKLKYKSDNEEVATVDDLGLIKTKTIGTATITVSSVDNESISDKLTLEVIKANTKAEKISLSESSLKLATNQTIELKATVLPEETADKSLEWSSSNKEIATVDSFGKITAKKEGDVTITAKTSNGILSKCEVEIANIQVESIDLSEENLTLERGKEKKISAIIKPENANDKKITWNSENDTIAEVSTEGTIKAITIGTVSIIARTSNGKKDTIKVTVIEPNDSTQATSNSTVITPTASSKIVYPSEIILELDKIELYLNEQQQIIATVEPEDTTNKSITWSSSDSNVASVNSNGLVTAINAGTAIVTAKTSNGKTSDAEVIVYKSPDEPTGVSLNATLANIYVGEQQQITAKVNPDTAIDKTVTWSSSDSNVANVNSNGLITGVNSGSATITAKTNNNKTTLVKVVVNNNTNVITNNVVVTSIALNIKKVLLDPNKRQQVTVVFTPNNASNKTVTWTSSNTDIATITDSGLITAKNSGTAIITVKTNNNITATADVIVSGNQTTTPTLVLTPTDEADTTTTEDDAPAEIDTTAEDTDSTTLTPGLSVNGVIGPPAGAIIVKSSKSPTLVTSIEKQKSYYIARVWVEDATTQIKKGITATWGSSLQTLSDMGKKEIDWMKLTDKTMVAINGSAWHSPGVDNYGPYNYTSIGTLALLNGQILRNDYNNTSYKYSDLYYYAINGEGDLKGFHENKSNRATMYQTMVNDGVKNTFVFFNYPPIVINGNIFITDNSGKKASRTAFCQIDKNNFILMTTRGKRSLRQIATSLKELGCVTAVNLDGGSSIGMTFKSAGESSMTVIRYAQRKVADMLYVTD